MHKKTVGGQIMIALLITNEEELEKIKEKLNIDPKDIRLPGLYYEFQGNCIVKDIEYKDQLEFFGYIIARPIL